MINPSANVFLFGDFNIHNKDWLTCSGGTDITYNFSISNDVAQVVNFPAWIPDCDSHSPILLGLKMAFPPLGNSDHIVVPLTFNHIDNGMLHFITLLMTILVLIWTDFMIIWEIFHGWISLNSALLLMPVNFVSGLKLEMLYEQRQKWTLFCFKMILPYILNFTGNKKMWLTLIFWCFIKLDDWAFQQKKNKILWLTWSKVMALTSKWEIAADIGIWLTHPSHLE